jgi:hypothetical protein
MKTRQLIKLLQEADPEGEFDVVIGNKSILWVNVLPAYYDGRLERLHTKDELPPKNVGDITYGEYIVEGYKIILDYRSIKDFIFDYGLVGKHFPVILDNASGYLREETNNFREEANDLKKHYDKLKEKL